jgi:hypothetical protein
MEQGVFEDMARMQKKGRSYSEIPKKLIVEKEPIQ